eukprot:13180_1
MMAQESLNDKKININDIPNAQDLLRDKSISKETLIYYISLYQQQNQQHSNIISTDNENKVTEEYNNTLIDKLDSCIEVLNKPILAELCVCGAHLELLDAENTYSGAGVCCNECNQTIKKTLYHCPLEYNVSHSRGYDICVNCWNKPKTHEIFTDFKASFIPLDEAKLLKVNDKFDYRDHLGLFKPVSVIKKIDTNLKLKWKDVSLKKRISVNLHEKGAETTIKPAFWVSYANELNNFAKLGAVSKRKSHRFKQLKIGDFVDVNPMYKHPGWKCGRILYVDKVEETQIWVNYEFDDEMHGIWTHLDNQDEIAEFGTKSDRQGALTCHHYKAYLGLNNLQKSKMDKNLLIELQTCCSLIKQELIPAKQIKSELMHYLFDLRRGLFDSVICDDLKEHQDNDKMVQIFDDMYSSILQEKRILSDQNQLQLTDDILECDNDYTEFINDESVNNNKNIIYSIKVKWFTINDMKEDPNEENHNAYDCISIKRIEYLLNLFDTYFIDQYIVDKNKQQDKQTENILDFMTIYNNCVNKTDQYPVHKLIDDIIHIKEYHMHQVLKTNEILNHCLNQPCIMNQRDVENENLSSYFGYISTHDVNIIRQMVNAHIYFLHKQIFNPSPFLQRISSNVLESKRKTNDKYTKFATEVSNSKSAKFQFGIKLFYKKHFKHYAAYIKRPHYNNLKVELLNNKIYSITMEIFYTELINALNYFRSQKIKKLKASNRGNENKMDECPVGAPISISHILCVLLYTNHTKLQYMFKKHGCRKKK